MILILCHLHDAEAAWLAHGLQQVGAPVLIVSADELLLARAVSHRLGHAGADFAITLQNGQCIRKDVISAVINRLSYLDPILWKRADPKQYQYVAQEFNALYLSLLHSVGQVRLYNPPTAMSLSGRHLSVAEWQLLGLRAGLPIAPNWPPPDSLPVAPPDARLLVLDGRQLGTLPPGIDPVACQRLVHDSGMNLLELHFSETQTGWVFAGATVFASLHSYGNDLINHFLNHDTNLGHTERSTHSALA